MFLEHTQPNPPHILSASSRRIVPTSAPSLHGACSPSYATVRFVSVVVDALMSDKPKSFYELEIDRVYSEGRFGRRSMFRCGSRGRLWTGTTLRRLS